MARVLAQKRERLHQLLESRLFILVQLALQLPRGKVLPQGFHLRQTHADIESHGPLSARRTQTGQLALKPTPSSTGPPICPASSRTGQKGLVVPSAGAAPAHSNRWQTL